jgi:dTMP kinase
MSGWFVVLEGPEGSGKSTQARLLARALEGDGYRVALTREPGGTPIGEQIRHVLLDPANCAMLAETEALLISAARAQHVAEVIRPALADGKVVVCDRYVDSTFAYQGGGRGLALEALRAIQELATGGLRPDRRVLLDLPVDVGLERRLTVEGEVNRLDLAERSFHHRVRETYLRLAASDSAGWAVVDAGGSVDDVARQVYAAIRASLPPPS